MGAGERPGRDGCGEYREIVSARLDGEATPEQERHVDAHLDGCAPCREFGERAARVTRLARVAPVRPVPDLTDAVAAALGDPPPPARRAPRQRVADLARCGLAAVALGQVALVVSGVVAVGQAAHRGGHIAGASAAHLVHESSAWNLALAVAFGVTAAARTRPPGMLAVVGAFVGMLVLLSGLDLVAGRVDPGRLGGHVLVLAGFLLLLALRRADGDGDAAAGTRPGPAGRAAPAAPALRTRRRRGPGVASVFRLAA